MERLLIIIKKKTNIMRNILLFLALSSTILFTSCQGDPGPPGPEGQPGINILGQVFEENINFQFNSGENTFSSNVISFPSDVVVYESDVILVYRYEGPTNIGNNETADIWTQLPQNIFFQDGTGDIFQYTFNHTFVDIQFVIDGNFDLSTLGTAFTNNQIFRIAVVPSEYATADLTMEQLMANPEIEVLNVQNISN